MKIQTPLLLGAPPLLFLLTSCNTAQAPVAQNAKTAIPAQAKLSPTQQLAKTCRVCVVESGQFIEEFLPSRLDKKVNGQTYRFCADKCREKFDKSPQKFLVSR